MKISFSFLLISGLLSSACALKSRRTEDLPPTPAQAAAPTAPVQAPAAHEESKSSAAAEAAPTDAHATASNTTGSASAHTTPPAAHHQEKKGVEASKALGWLKNGNTRYRKGFLRKDGQSQKDIQRLASGQAPHSIVLSCSDSRVPPEIVFDQKLGEIFVVRNAGEIPDPASIASIEYAIEHLGSR